MKTIKVIATKPISFGEIVTLGGNAISIKDNAINLIKKQPFFYATNSSC